MLSGSRRWRCARSSPSSHSMATYGRPLSSSTPKATVLTMPGWSRLAEQLALAHQALLFVGGDARVGGDDLERDRALGRQVVGAVDDAYPTSAYLAFDDEPAAKAPALGVGRLFQVARRSVALRERGRKPTRIPMPCVENRQVSRTAGTNRGSLRRARGIVRLRSIRRGARYGITFTYRGAFVGSRVGFGTAGLQHRRAQKVRAGDARQARRDAAWRATTATPGLACLNGICAKNEFNIDVSGQAVRSAIECSEATDCCGDKATRSAGQVRGSERDL